MGLIADGTRSHVGRLVKDFDGFIGHMNHWTGRYQRLDHYVAHDVGWLIGRLWLLFVHTGDEEFKDLALRVMKPIIPEVTTAPGNNLSSGVEIFFGLCVASDILGSDEFHDLAIKASRMQVAGRWRDDLGRFIPWPGFDEREVPLEWGGMLYHLAWTGLAEPRHRDLFVRHHETLLAHRLIRADGSTAHVALLDREGRIDRHATLQGYADDSIWARGQAWAIHNFVALSDVTSNPDFDDALDRMVRWWRDHVPADHVPFYDFNDPRGSDGPRDSCAAAMATSALMRLPEDSGLTPLIAATIEELCENYVSPGGILLHGSLGDVRRGIYGAATTTDPPGHGDPRAVRARFPQEDIMPYGSYFIAEIIHRALTGGMHFAALSPRAGLAEA